MPQATIKLQQAPAPATAMRKPAAPGAADTPKGEVKDLKPLSPVAKHEPILSDAEEDSESGGVESVIPLPLLIVAAVLALAALGIQIWTFIS